MIKDMYSIIVVIFGNAGVIPSFNLFYTFNSLLTWAVTETDDGITRFSPKLFSPKEVKSPEIRRHITLFLTIFVVLSTSSLNYINPKPCYREDRHVKIA